MKLQRIETARAGQERPVFDENAAPDHAIRRDTAGLKTVLKIAEAWKESNAELATLLGVPERTLYSWKNKIMAGETVGPLSRDTVERISYLLGIWNALTILFPEEARRREWLRLPNTSVTFAGQSPIERLHRGNVADLFVVRRYLDGWRG